MSKNIFVLNGPNDINPFGNRASFDPVAVSNLESIVNNYCNLICVTCLEDVDESTKDRILSCVHSKLRPGGEALIVITDKQNLCRLYVDQVITDTEFMSQILYSKYPISETEIINKMSDTFQLINMARSDGKITIHLGKK